MSDHRAGHLGHAQDSSTSAAFFRDSVSKVPVDTTCVFNKIHGKSGIYNATCWYPRLFFPVHVQSLHSRQNEIYQIRSHDSQVYQHKRLASDPGHLATSEYSIHHKCIQMLATTEAKSCLLAIVFYEPCQSVIFSQHRRPGRYLFQAAEEFHHHLRPWGFPKNPKSTTSKRSALGID